MKILCIGDPHFTVGNAEFTDALLRHVKKLLPNIDRVVVMGDVLDTYERVNTRVLQRAYDFLHCLADAHPTVCLIGNHDLPSDKHAFSDTHAFYKHTYPNLTFVDSDVYIADGYLYVPYLPPNQFLPLLHEREIDINEYPYIFCHQEFAGMVYDGGETTKVTETIPDDYQGLVICGHIHQRQSLPRIYCVGTPYQTRNGESHDKGLTILDTSTGELDYHRSKYVIQRRTLTLRYREYLEYKWDRLRRRSIYRITVECANSAESTAIRKHAYTLQLRKLGHQVHCTRINEEHTHQLQVLAPATNFRRGLEEYLGIHAPNLVDLLSEIEEN